MASHAKNLRMAEQMAGAAAVMRKGTRIAVAGNDAEHANTLITMIYEAAKRMGLDVSHITFSPISGEELVKAHKEKARTKIDDQDEEDTGPYKH